MCTQQTQISLHIFTVCLRTLLILGYLQSAMQRLSILLGYAGLPSLSWYICNLIDNALPWFKLKLHSVFCLNQLSWVVFFVLRFYGPVNPLGSSWGKPVYLTTLFTGQYWSSKQSTSIVHILATDNCPSWISGRERMNIKNISLSVSMKECCWHSGGQTCNLLIASRMRIQLSHQGLLCWAGVLQSS